MTRKLLLSPFDLAAYALGSGRTFAEYFARRLQRA
jgi:hypothetical protein